VNPRRLNDNYGCLSRAGRDLKSKAAIGRPALASNNQWTRAAVWPIRAWLARWDDDRLVSPSFISAHRASCTSSTTVSVGWKKEILTVLDASLIQGGRLPQALTKLAVRDRHPLDRGAYYPLISPDDLTIRWEQTMKCYELGDARDNCPEAFEPGVDKYFAWMAGTTANLALHRSILERVGGFDDRYVRWGFEDTDLCFKLYRAGATFANSLAALSYHQLHSFDGMAAGEAAWKRNQL